METQKLNYKGTNIAKAEQKYGVKFFNVVEQLGKKSETNIGMLDMLFLYCAGGGTEEDFDQYIVNDTEKIMLDIMEGLAMSGFLGEKKNFDRAKAKAEIEKAIKASKE